MANSVSNCKLGNISNIKIMSLMVIIGNNLQPKTNGLDPGLWMVKNVVNCYLRHKMRLTLLYLGLKIEIANE